MDVGFRNISIILLALLFSPHCSATYPNGYSYRVTITAAPGAITGTLSNFPFELNGTYSYFATTTHGGYVQNTVVGSGLPADLIFTSDASGSTSLCWEIESYNPNTGAILAWVRWPSISSGATIYAFIGNATVTALQTSPACVWSNYAGVWHFGNGTTLSATDSSGKSTSSYSNVTATTGKIDGGAAFSSSSAIVNTGYTSHATQRSYSVWLYCSGVGGGGMGRIFDKKTSGANSEIWYIEYGGNALSFSRYFSISEGAWSVPFTLKAWHYAVITYDSSTATNSPAVYIDGVQRTVSLIASPSGTAVNNTDPYQIGNRGDLTRNFAGTIDEFRIFNGIETPAWVTAEYNNQLSPATFYGIQLDTSVPLSQRQITTLQVSDVTATTPDPNNARATIAGTWLTTPTYDGSGQSIHPSVKYVPTEWNGHKWWMANSPFTNSNPAVENPSIYYSDNGDSPAATWTPIPNNPIDSYPALNGVANSMWSDPELAFSEDMSTLYCVYRSAQPANSSDEELYYKQSTDGVTWSARVGPILTSIHTPPAQLFSQTIIFDLRQPPSQQWQMFAESRVVGIRHFSASSIAGPWIEEPLPTFNPPLPSPPDHIGAMYEDGVYYLVAAQTNGTVETLATSVNGNYWVTSSTALISSIGSSWCENMYRPYMQRLPSGSMGLWYGCYAPGGSVTHTGMSVVTWPIIYSNILSWEWSQDPFDPATGFHIWRSVTTPVPVGGSAIPLATVSSPDTLTYVDGPISAGQAWNYVVTAFNSTEESLPSNAVTAYAPN